MAERLALYFGRWDVPGHYLHRKNGLSIWEPREVGCPWSLGHMDGMLLKNGGHSDICDGKVWWTCGGRPDLWHAFFWWDRSGDRRPGSNSGLYVRGFNLEQREEAFAYGLEQFPRIAERQAHTLVLQPRRFQPEAEK